MLESDKIVLRYKVMSNTASKVSKVAKELATICDASYFNKDKYELNCKHLKKYIEELQELYDKSLE